MRYPAFFIEREAELPEERETVCRRIVSFTKKS